MKPQISIIGVGALGRTLASALHAEGYPIAGLYNRSESAATNITSQVGAGRSGAFPAAADELGDIIFLAVGDEDIEAAAASLGAISGSVSGRTIAHCSGTMTADRLQVLADQGAHTAAFHPLQTFSSATGADAFSGITVSLQGSTEAVNTLSEVAAELDARVLHLSSEAKAHLHLAAVIASNYLVTLMQKAGEAAELGGIGHRDARRALQALVQTTAKNLAADDLSDVLSGPIARGDLATIQRHLELLEKQPDLRSLYKILGRETVTVVEGGTSADSGQLQKIRDLLKG